MASCQQYESKPTLLQKQIVRVSCEAYSDRDIGVLDDKKIRLLFRNILDVTQTWLKVDQGSISDNAFILVQLLPANDVGTDNNIPEEVLSRGKGVGTAKKICEEVTLVEMAKIETWTKSWDEAGGGLYISGAYVNDDKVWTAEESCDGIKIMLRAKEPGNKNSTG